MNGFGKIFRAYLQEQPLLPISAKSVEHVLAEASYHEDHFDGGYECVILSRESRSATRLNEASALELLRTV